MEPLQNKNRDGWPATKRATQELTGDDKNFVVTTNLGNEFATLDRKLPVEAVRRTKRLEDCNATAVTRQPAVVQVSCPSSLAELGQVALQEENT